MLDIVAFRSLKRHTFYECIRTRNVIQDAFFVEHQANAGA
jgi:hypothetical protein